jgi:hypothetical protein
MEYELMGPQAYSTLYPSYQITTKTHTPNTLARGGTAQQKPSAVAKSCSHAVFGWALESNGQSRRRSRSSRSPPPVLQDGAVSESDSRRGDKKLRRVTNTPDGEW